MVTAPQKIIESNGSDELNVAEQVNQQAALQQAAALIQQNSERMLRECHDKVTAILDEYGFEMVAVTTIQGNKVSSSVVYQRKAVG